MAREPLPGVLTRKGPSRACRYVLTMLLALMVAQSELAKFPVSRAAAAVALGAARASTAQGQMVRVRNAQALIRCRAAHVRCSPPAGRHARHAPADNGHFRLLPGPHPGPAAAGQRRGQCPCLCSLPQLLPGRGRWRWAPPAANPPPLPPLQVITRKFIYYRLLSLGVLMDLNDQPLFKSWFTWCGPCLCTQHRGKQPLVLHALSSSAPHTAGTSFPRG